MSSSVGFSGGTFSLSESTKDVPYTGSDDKSDGELGAKATRAGAGYLTGTSPTIGAVPDSGVVPEFAPVADSGVVPEYGAIPNSGGATDFPEAFGPGADMGTPVFWATPNPDTGLDTSGLGTDPLPFAAADGACLPDVDGLSLPRKPLTNQLNLSVEIKYFSDYHIKIKLTLNIDINIKFAKKGAASPSPPPPPTTGTPLTTYDYHQTKQSRGSNISPVCVSFLVFK